MSPCGGRHPAQSPSLHCADRESFLYSYLYPTGSISFSFPSAKCPLTKDTHTLTHMHMRSSLRKSRSKQEGRNRRKIHFEERETKGTRFAIWYKYRRWEPGLYGSISLYQFNSKHSRYLFYSMMGFNILSLPSPRQKNYSSFCMGSMVDF